MVFFGILHIYNRFLSIDKIPLLYPIWKFFDSSWKYFDNIRIFICVSIMCIYFLLLMLFYFFLNFLKYLFIFEREIKHEQGRCRERGRERIPSRLYDQPEPDMGLDLTIGRSLPEPISRVRCLSNWATQVPHVFPIILIFF